ncbi:hypothetical protein JDV02_008298 [Purpureocillium takamizusanense]|uniref:Uncharacterized protein n=1 Tax=Purpureocillium takamizusanense TaxID=2060973 RepID=A0A9Q8QND7_9HYPO|nr:uncharacterized protein JDV02_008298 [Purpureocillium takamizusanense]UNI22407.1 hypothetical protein JDV02_008298 [Purpureocillium takamizusanense]
MAAQQPVATDDDEARQQLLQQRRPPNADTRGMTVAPWFRAGAATAGPDLMGEPEPETWKAMKRYWESKLALEEQLDLLQKLREAGDGGVGDTVNDQAVEAARAPLGDMLSEYELAFAAAEAQGWQPAWYPIPQSFKDARGQRRARRSEETNNLSQEKRDNTWPGGRAS